MGLAGAGSGSAALPARQRSVCRGPAPRDRHRRSDGNFRGRPGGRGSFLRRNRPGGRPDGLDSDEGRVFGHAPASRLGRRAARDGPCGGRRRGNRGSERRGGAAGALPLSRRAAKLGAERVPGSAPVPAWPRGSADRAICDRRRVSACELGSSRRSRVAGGRCPPPGAGAAGGEDRCGECFGRSRRRGGAEGCATRTGRSGAAARAR